MNVASPLPASALTTVDRARLSAAAEGLRTVADQFTAARSSLADAHARTSSGNQSRWRDIGSRAYFTLREGEQAIANATAGLRNLTSGEYRSAADEFIADALKQFAFEADGLSEWGPKIPWNVSSIYADLGVRSMGIAAASVSTAAEGVAALARA